MDIKEKRAHLESLQMPLLHLNGSGYHNLSKALEEAQMAIMDACEALNQTAPHGRDYYPLKDGAYEKARDEHLSRGRKLCEVMDELMAIQHRLYECKKG